MQSTVFLFIIYGESLIIFRFQNLIIHWSGIVFTDTCLRALLFAVKI